MNFLSWNYGDRKIEEEKKVKWDIDKRAYKGRKVILLAILSLKLVIIRSLKDGDEFIFNSCQGR